MLPRTIEVLFLAMEHMAKEDHERLKFEGAAHETRKAWLSFLS
jgi:hypothetical protein